MEVGLSAGFLGGGTCEQGLEWKEMLSWGWGAGAEIGEEDERLERQARQEGQPEPPSPHCFL